MLNYLVAKATFRIVLSLSAVMICCGLSFHAQAAGPLHQYFKYKSEGQHRSAKKTLDKWVPKSLEEEYYKKYFTALNENKTEQYWELYQQLSKSKKLLKLQHESIKKILENDLNAKVSTSKKIKEFPKVAKLMLRNLRGQPEGVEYELLYLKWILKNKNIKELCKTERQRWLSQSTLQLDEVLAGLESCPASFDDFTYRIRMLVFAGEEIKARAEINQYTELQKLEPWHKAYLQAVYYSNVGDPTAAFDIIKDFKQVLSESDDYDDNLFFIAQRAGELKFAEDVINFILAKKNHRAKERREFSFQKAFLYYQTRRYKEALPILNQLIRTHASHRKKTKSREYDDLTWLRAWCYYLAKDFEKAKDSLLENKKWARDKARNLYWLAQTEWALDHQVAAVVYFKQLALPVLEGRFFSYYNYMAWLKFESYKSFAATELMREQLMSIKNGRGLYALPDFSMNPIKLAQEYQSYFEDIGATDEGNISIINQEDELADRAELGGIRARSESDLKNELSWADDLIKWGYRDLAKWHLFEIEKNLTTRYQAEPLINYYLEQQYYNRALSLTNSVLSYSGRKLNLQDEPLLWKSLYPLAFEKDVREQASKRAISPYLVWSIMKAETQYKHDAISPVGALGLMQFMPYTSQKVAIMLKEEHRSEMLFDPSVAVRYGAMYLKKLGDELGGQLPLMAAAYNGGPHRVKLWLRNLKQRDGSNLDFDVFVEHIPFNETRTYTKRVISFYLTYHKLYEEKLDYKATKWLIEKNPFQIKEPILLKEEWPFSQTKSPATSFELKQRVAIESLKEQPQ